MATFDDFLNTLEKEIVAFAEKGWNSYKNSAIEDGSTFVEKTKADLKRWTQMLALGQLSKDDFEWLVVGKKDLAELEALKQAGLTQVALDRFVNGLVDVIINTAFTVFLA